MCQHCCRMEWTPCEPIPYACPLCPVRQLSDCCNGSSNGNCRLKYPSSHNKSLLKHSDLCKDISELYSYVVSAKRNKMRRTKRRRILRWNEPNKSVIPAAFVDPEQQKPREEDTWTWKSRFPVSAKVLPVKPRVAVLPSKWDRTADQLTQS